MAVLAGLVALTTIASGFLAERSLRARERVRVEQSLQERGELVAELMGPVAGVPRGAPELVARVDRAARSAGARVTVIGPGGSVLADSKVLPEALPRLENHRDRPEVRGALAGRVTRAERQSRTLGGELFYVALPLGDPGDGVLRLAVGTEALEAAVADLRGRLLVAGAIGMLAALVLSLGVSWVSVRPLQEMRDALRAIAAGDLSRRLRPHADDELGEIADAINAVGEQLGLRLAEITAEKEQLQAVLAGMVEGVLVLDADGCVVLANPRLRELLSIWGPVTGRTLLEVIRHPGIDEALSAARHSSTAVVSEVESGGRILLIHAAGFPPAGARAGTVAVFHDVTELRHLESVRRDFVANASHELQTPLTAIRGFAETLLANPVEPDEAKAQLEVILRNAERLGNLIRDMLELSRIESRRVPLEPGEIDVVRLTGALLQDMGPRFRERSLAAAVDVEEAAPAWADRRAVEQVLTNLLDNAAKYTDPGGRIRVEIGRVGDSVRVRVGDTGIGIPERDRARIFERFYRVDKARSRALGGTGLGLAIVKHLVQTMGGDIYVESEPGKGSTFTFTLPRADSREEG